MKILRWLLAGCFIAVVVLAAEPTAKKSAEAEIFVEFALYFAPKPAADPEALLRKLVAEPAYRMRFDDAENPGAVARVFARWTPLTEYRPPDARNLRYTGVGVKPELADALAEAERVFVVGFKTTRSGAFVTNRQACRLFAELARATGGYIWDEETRQVFSLAAWEQRRVATWQDNLPDMREHVTMHAYANPELLRIITLGMRKFGLPDVVFPEAPRQYSRGFGNTINALIQRLAEGERAQDNRLRLRLADIRHAAARESALANPGERATGVAELSLTPAALEEGDPKNTLWRIDFPGEKGAEAIERAMAGMDRLFGSTDKVTGVRSRDDEMLAARERARAAFFAQEKRFRAGLAVGEHLLVKGPFREEGQTEYMWVEVVSWGPRHVEGILSSEPHYVKRLRSGARVQVTFDEIYDYILHKPGGEEEGNETGKVLQRREQNQR